MVNGSWLIVLGSGPFLCRLRAVGCTRPATMGRYEDKDQQFQYCDDERPLLTQAPTSFAYVYD